MGVNFYGDANSVTVKLLQNAWIGNHWSLEMFEKKKMKLGRFVSLLNFLQKVIKKLFCRSFILLIVNVEVHHQYT